MIFAALEDGARSVTGVEIRPANQNMAALGVDRARYQFTAADACERPDLFRQPFVGTSFNQCGSMFELT
jgi:hypothetical protein